MIRGTHSTFISNGINGELLLCWWGPECDIVVVCVIFIEDVQLQARCLSTQLLNTNSLGTTMALV